MEIVAIVTILALIECFVFSILVARARHSLGIEPPTMVGDPIFERYQRVHQNTLEQLILFLPSLWIFAYYVHVQAAAILGLVFIAGRGLYCRGYIAAAEKRTLGFVIGQIATSVLLLGGLAGASISWW